MYTLVIDNLKNNGITSNIISPSAKLIKNDDYKIFHFFDDYILCNSEVIGYDDSIALKSHNNASKILNSRGTEECKVLNSVEWRYPYEVQVFCTYRDSLDKYSLEFRGIVSESILGGWSNDNIRDMELFGSYLSIDIDEELNEVNITPESPFNMAEDFIIEDCSDFETNCKTDVLKVGFTKSGYEKEKQINRSPTIVH